MGDHGDRRAFLARTRARIQAGGEKGAGPGRMRPLAPVEGVPPVDYLADFTDLSALFISAVTGLLGHVCTEGTAAAVREVCAAHRVARAVVSRDPECEGVEEMLAGLGVEVLPWGGPAAAAGADLGVTGAVGAVALTGSVIVAADRAGGRTASLLPPIHLALVPARQLVARPGDFLRTLLDRYPDGVPSNLVFISGPSRSADIELQLTLGVHGPRELWVALLPDG